MKAFKNTLILCLFLTFLSSSAQTVRDKFIGKWKGVDGGDIGYFIVDAVEHASFVYNGQVMGGKSFDYDGKNAKMKFQVTEQEDGIYYLDLSIIIIDSGITESKMLCIVKFLDYDTMKFGSNFGSGDRPLVFSDDNSLIFKRQKN